MITAKPLAGLIGVLAALAPAVGPARATGQELVQLLPVQGKVYVLQGEGANMAVQVGPDGLLVVDTLPAHLTEAVMAAIRKLSDRPLRYIVNTHFHADHTGGNERLSKTGRAIVHDFAAAPGATEPATIVAHENVLTRMSAAPEAFPAGGLPMSTYYRALKDLFFNGEPIQLVHQPHAHTDGDSIVIFRRSDVVATGDLFNFASFPVIDPAEGGSIQGVLAGLNRLLDIVVPEERQEGGTYIIPGHGRIADEADLLEYRDMVTIIRDRVKAAVDKGMTLDETRAARLARDYEGRYATRTWTGDMFVSAIYRELSQARNRPAPSS